MYSITFKFVKICFLILNRTPCVVRGSNISHCQSLIFASRIIMVVYALKWIILFKHFAKRIDKALWFQYTRTKHRIISILVACVTYTYVDTNIAYE